MATCGGIWQPFAAEFGPFKKIVCELASWRSCRLAATRFGVLAGWMADDLRELRSVSWLAEGLAGW